MRQGPSRTADTAARPRSTGLFCWRFARWGVTPARTVSQRMARPPPTAPGGRRGRVFGQRFGGDADVGLAFEQLFGHLLRRALVQHHLGVHAAEVTHHKWQRTTRLGARGGNGRRAAAGLRQVHAATAHVVGVHQQALATERSCWQFTGGCRPAVRQSQGSAVDPGQAPCDTERRFVTTPMRQSDLRGGLGHHRVSRCHPPQPCMHSPIFPPVSRPATGAPSTPRCQPVMTVDSGQRFTVDTVSGGAAVLPPPGFHVPPELLDIHARSPMLAPGHILTGPVAVDGCRCPATCWRCASSTCNCGRTGATT